jgi:hypothetical protein
MSRTSKPCSRRPPHLARRADVAALSLLAVLALAGCAAPVASASSTAPARPAGVEGAPERTTRAPDSVAIDPPAALPAALPRAAAGGVVALRVPVSREAVASLLRAFFAAWARESLEDLVALLVPDAGALGARARGSRVLVDEWRQRMRSREYGRLAGIEMVEPDRIERWEPDELGGDGAPQRIDARPGELAVRVPVEVPSVGGERLFGDFLVLILRPEEGKLRIAAYGEVDAH